MIQDTSEDGLVLTIPGYNKLGFLIEDKFLLDSRNAPIISNLPICIKQFQLLTSPVTGKISTTETSFFCFQDACATYDTFSFYFMFYIFECLVVSIFNLTYNVKEMVVK